MRLVEIPHAFSAAVSACSAAGTWLALVKDWVLQLFGVPLPVFLAAAAGAFAARTFMPATGLWRTLGGGLLWTLIGTFGADGVRQIVSSSTSGGGTPLMALLIAGFGQILFTPEIIQKVRDAVARRIDAFSKKE